MKITELWLIQKDIIFVSFVFSCFCLNEFTTLSGLRRPTTAPVSTSDVNQNAEKLNTRDYFLQLNCGAFLFDASVTSFKRSL